MRGKQYEMEKKAQGGTGANQHTKEQSVQSANTANEKNQETQRTAEKLAEQYHVSKDTIIRDAKVAKAIDEIGKTSPIAKQKILAGEVGTDGLHGTDGTEKSQRTTQLKNNL